jgi:hypothetical protein
LEKRSPEDRFVNFDYAPVLRALSALGRGKPTDSLERLQIALPYELAANGLNFNHFYLGGLHSAYVRGEALIAAHRYAEAAAEFQKILDHRLWAWIPSSRWRIGNWAEHSSYWEKKTGPGAPTRTSSLSGKTPIPTFLS